jgi:hypothetical protein
MGAPQPSMRAHRALSRPRTPPRVALGLAFVLISALAASLPARAQTGLRFDGVNDYVTFGQATGTLGARTFTIEVWFMRTGAGNTTSTGNSGLADVVPLLAKGRGQADGSTADCNYFLGVQNIPNVVLAADYEDFAASNNNHTLVGTTVLRNDVWYHAAATYDGATFRLYLNGNLEASVATTAVPRFDSIQHASLGSALNTTPVAAGFFAGVLDEARVWDHARPQAGIRDSARLEIASSPGLLGRWGLNDGTGTSAANSVGGSPAGTLTNFATPPPSPWLAGSPFAYAYGIVLGGTSGYATFGDPAALDLAIFTVETWFRRDGAGTPVSTGPDGISDAIPLVSHGAPEADGSDVDMNFVLALKSTGELCADFEEGAGGASPGQNHPVVGTTVVADATWHHAAATYDGTTWNLYLDGNLEDASLVGQPVQSATTQRAALGTMLTSVGVANGFFQGALDEARIWNIPRSQPQIIASINSQLTGAPGLVARWGLDEGGGRVVRDTSGSAVHGALTPAPVTSAWGWIAGAPFNLAIGPVADPTNLTATATTHTRIELAWADNSNNESGFEIERSTSGSGGPFSPLASVAANSQAYSDLDLTPSSQYCYRVRGTAVAPSGYAGPACATTPATSATALDFTSSVTYANFGNAGALHLSQFTIELWLRRDGAGSGTNTGTGGIADAIPLVTRGRADGDDPAKDINYFLGIRAATGVLCADLEEGTGGTSPGANHPILGTTPIGTGSWHHVAVTYDGTMWLLYLDGNLEGQLIVGQPAASASNMAVALGSALNSTGVASGSFDGAVDEVRIWNVARTQVEIQSTANTQLAEPQAGLVARWSLDEGLGTVVNGSAGTAVNGTITGGGHTWIPGAPFDLVLNQPPAQPVLGAPANGATGVSTAPSLDVSVSDAEGGSLTVTWYGRPITPSPGPDFTLIGIPDTQYYTGQVNGGTNAIFQSQTDWIVANRAARNIVYAAHLGDCVENGDNGGNDIEWQRADLSLSTLENPVTTGLPEGIPFGVSVGNHDQSPEGTPPPAGTTTLYNQYFGESRFSGRSYYGGHYGTSNNNWYQLFSASGMDFIVVSLEFDPSPDAAVLSWADALLTTHAGRRAIVVSHWIVNSGNPGTFSTQGRAIYDALKSHPGLFLMLGGHISTEGRRQDTFNGTTVHSVLSDYQSRPNGGSGWLRILEFSPASNVVRVRTYSPWLGQFEADADSSSQFTLSHDMSSAVPYQVLGSASVGSGSSAAIVWPGLAGTTQYQWYVTVSDGSITTTSPTWTFTTSPSVGVDDVPPREVALAPVRPNPSSGQVQLSFALPAASPVRLSVLDIMGREVAVLADGVFGPGRHPVVWDGRGASARLHSGLYLVRLRTPGRSEVRKMVWVR